MGNRGISAEEIYSALLDDEAFAQLPTRLAQTFGARSTVIHWHHHDGSADIMAHSRYFSDDQLIKYATEFAPLDPWAQAANRQSANHALDLESLVPDTLYERSSFYNEFIRPMGDDTYRCMGVRVQSVDGAGMIAIQRGKGQRRYEPGQVAQLAEASGHLRRLLAVRGKLAALQRHTLKLETILNVMPQAVFVVDHDQKLIRGNSAAEALLRRGEALAVRAGRVHSPAKNSGRLLKRALELACCPSPTSSAVLLEQREGKPLLATIMPMPSFARQALIIVEDVLRSNEGVITQLQAFFGLTRAEAMIAVRLADGHALPEIAAERGASLATVRAQLKSLLQKMDCHRQSEAVAMINKIVPVSSQLPAGI